MNRKKNTRASRNAPIVSIGAQPATIKEANSAIKAILGAPHADEETKREALRSLATVCNVNGTVISNTSING